MTYDAGVRWVVLASVFWAAGCQQLLGIDEGVIATVGHDEDRDTIDDGIDNCPADVNVTQATNEPRIGRVCDPRPEESGDRIAMFFSFYPAGEPDALESEGEVDYAADMVRLENARLTTRKTLEPTVVSADLTFDTFTGTSAYVELAVGDRSCRIASCNSRICISAADEADTSSVEFTPTALGVTLALVQSDTVFACVLTLQGVAVTLPRNTAIRDRVEVRVAESSMFVQSLTIYDVQ